MQTLRWLLLVAVVGTGVHFAIQYVSGGTSVYSIESPVLPLIEELERSDPELGKKARAGMNRFNKNCRLCHHPTGHGGKFTPSLLGHTEDSIKVMLNHYRDGQKVGPMTNLMAPWAKELSDEEIHILGIYIELLQQAPSSK
ncbi:MAG: cytochrome c [Gammaproteobacteria bacterium]|nr:cytochrome c [Gammaproteobacteria bacterium]MCW8840379.1 cytochrome c [Gammaproteobacteria bacterium]MCW8958166.1 cytochrome c [Gammaproteobacteria bacterium]MCW8973155.1 cytochrome c [Gammaproteobacteria bacterium]MCW8991903.1 cytochrome c [Gammaproteobacteria bacterium]